MTTETNSPEATVSAEAQAAAQAALHSAIKAKFNNQVDVKSFKFHFKKVKDEATGIENKRPTVELDLPVPSIEGIVAILEGGDEKSISLLLEAVENIVTDRARELVNENEGISQENFPLDSVSWLTIANLPKADRRGGGIAKETWEDFAKDYVAVMPGATGKTAEQVTNASKIFLNKFAQVKTMKPMIAKLKEQLGIYLGATKNGDVYSECVEFLLKKADALLAVDEAELLNNI